MNYKHGMFIISLVVFFQLINISIIVCTVTNMSSTLIIPDFIKIVHIFCSLFQINS